MTKIVIQKRADSFLAFLRFYIDAKTTDRLLYGPMPRKILDEYIKIWKSREKDRAKIEIIEEI